MSRPPIGHREAASPGPHGLRRALGLALSLALGGCIERHVHPAVYEATPPEGPYTIEIPVTADRYLVTDVGIGGEVRPFLVDTGAAMSVLDDDVAKALGLPSIGEARIIDFEGRRRDAPVIKVEALTLGGAEFRGVGMTVTDLDWLADAECKPIAGVLGNNVLAGALELDIGAGVVRLASSSERLAPRAGGVEAMAYPPTYNVNLPPVVATFIPEPVALDTGSPMAITVSRAVERKVQPKGARTVQAMIGGLHGSRAAERRLFAWPEIAFSGLDLEGVAAIGGAGSTTLGLGVLRSFVVRVDREARKLTFWPADVPLRRGLASMGLGIERAEAEARVSWLAEGSPAAEAGLRFGDVVITVDGAPLAAMPAEARCITLRDLPRRERARLGVRRGERLVEFEVERRELLQGARASSG